MKFGFVVLMLVLALPSQAEEVLIDLAAEIEAGIVQNQTTPNAAPANNANPAGSEESKQASAPEANQQTVEKVPKPDLPAQWGYYNEFAPMYWSGLDARYEACGKGKIQSPINLNDTQAINTLGLPSLDIAYREVPLRVIHSSNGFEGRYPLGSYIRLGAERFELTHYQLRTPSEHHLEGFAYPAEIQIYHRDGQGRQVVLSMIVSEGKPNPQLQTLLNHVPEEKDRLKVFEEVMFNPARLLPNDTRFYRYVGSLTTPPCTEGVIWLVFKKPIEASIGQLVALNELLGENSRPLQALNGRLPLKSWANDHQTPTPFRTPGYYFDY